MAPAELLFEHSALKCTHSPNRTLMFDDYMPWKLFPKITLNIPKISIHDKCTLAKMELKDWWTLN